MSKKYQPVNSDGEVEQREECGARKRPEIPDPMTANPDIQTVHVADGSVTTASLPSCDATLHSEA